VKIKNAKSVTVNYINEVKTKIFAQAMLPNLLWGFGFTATIWALRDFSLLQIVFLRFAIVGLCGLVWCLLFDRKQLRTLFPVTFLPSLFLIAEILFQVWGLKFTTATSAGFLTVTYVIMVPLIERFVRNKHVNLSHWLWVLLALFGTGILVNLQNMQLNIGDLLMLLSALGASLHLIATEKLLTKTPKLFLANMMQSLWGSILVLPALLMAHEPWIPNSVSILSWLGLGSLVFGSTMLAFYFQMRAQVHLSPTVSSLLFLVESPIAAVFGYILLNESLSAVQWIGGTLILAAAAGVVWRPHKN
jgi:drug/metabolite transporter (DMT)-like permease